MSAVIAGHLAAATHGILADLDSRKQGRLQKVKNGVKENNRGEQMHQSILGDGVVQLSSLIQMYHL